MQLNQVGRFRWAADLTELSTSDIEVWSRTLPDGRRTTVTKAAETPHVTKPVPAMLRRCTVSRYELWADGGGLVGSGLMGDQLRRGTTAEAERMLYGDKYQNTAKL